MDRFTTIHGHFYQPPRENPWLEEVELQDSAYPYHDWNERVTAECYAPNTASRILDSDQRIIDIINNYSRISFNFGPTLLSWMKPHHPDIYDGIIKADQKSRERFSGHGSAIAQAYNHLIMPLANTRDKQTQVKWGMKDFEFRFGRQPEGMWLPETAVDLETLDILAEHGITFTILAPRQAGKVKGPEDDEWKDVSNSSIDPKLPYLCKLPSGRTITLFFYDGPISQDIAFGDVLDNGEHFANRLTSTFSEKPEHAELSHVATDGETYGHHHHYGDMALAYCLRFLEKQGKTAPTIYGEYLEKHPPTYEVQIIENTSWSCIHGVERWRANCGCNTGMHPGWSQAWRAPLRGAMDWLRDNVAEIYEEHMAEFVDDPWKIRDAYIDVILDRSTESVDRFLSEQIKRTLSEEEQTTVLKLLELQRHALLMYTSCGWFFDEISGIETVQVIQYAARVMQLANDLSGIALEDAFIGLLERAPSNQAQFKNGGEVYRRLVKPTVLDLLRVGVHYGVSSLFLDYEPTTYLYTYRTTEIRYDRSEVGRQNLAVGTVKIHSEITREEETITFAVLHLGDHNIVGGARPFDSDESYQNMQKEIEASFKRSDISDVVRLIDKHFADHSYSLWHLFRDEQRRILDQLLDTSLKEIEGSLRQIYERHLPVMQAIEGVRMMLPRYFSMILEFVLNTDIRKILEADEVDMDRLEELVEDANRWTVQIDKTTLDFLAGDKIDNYMKQFSDSPEDTALLKHMHRFLKAIKELPLEPNIWQAQIILFNMAKDRYPSMKKRADSGDDGAAKWVTHFKQVGDLLKVKVE